MKQEEILKALVKELLGMDTLHEEYQDNNSIIVVDALKEDENTINIKVSLKENKDKEEFENWLKAVDDDLFEEVLDELKENNNLFNLNEIYNSNNYQTAIDAVKSKTRELAEKKIKQLQKLLD